MNTEREQHVRLACRALGCSAKALMARYPEYEGIGIYLPIHHDEKHPAVILLVALMESACFDLSPDSLASVVAASDAEIVETFDAYVSAYLSGELAVPFDVPLRLSEDFVHITADALLLMELELQSYYRGRTDDKDAVGIYIWGQKQKAGSLNERI